MNIFWKKNDKKYSTGNNFKILGSHYSPKNIYEVAKMSFNTRQWHLRVEQIHLHNTFSYLCPCITFFRQWWHAPSFSCILTLEFIVSITQLICVNILMYFHWLMCHERFPYSISHNITITDKKKKSVRLLNITTIFFWYT